MKWVHGMGSEDYLKAMERAGEAGEKVETNWMSEYMDKHGLLHENRFVEEPGWAADIAREDPIAVYMNVGHEEASIRCAAFALMPAKQREFYFGLRMTGCFMYDNGKEYREHPERFEVCRGERGYISPKLRVQILERDKYRCQMCGARAPDTVLVCDHVVPVKLGGLTTLGNLQALCVPCNQGKAAREVEGPGKE